MNYVMKFKVPYSLDAYEQVTLKERLEREIQSFMADKRIEVSYLCEEK